MRKKRHTTRNISSLRHLLFNPLLGSHFCLCFLGFVLQMHEQVNPFAEQPLSSWSFSFFISFDLWSFRSLSITSCFTAIRTCGSSVDKYQKYTHHRGKGHCTASPPPFNWTGLDLTKQGFVIFMYWNCLYETNQRPAVQWSLYQCSL